MSELKPANTEPAVERAREMREDLSRPRILDYLRDVTELLHPSNVRDRLTRDNVSNALKTFAWVAPLTVLIWVWAEREQLDDLVGQTVPVEVRLPLSDKVARIVDPPDRNVVVSLRGPRAQLDAIRSQLSQRAVGQRVALDLDPSLEATPEGYSIPAAALLQRSDFFRPYGVNISEVTPSHVRVVVSELETVDVAIQNPPADDYPNIGTGSVYQPSVVRITARKEDLEGATDPQRRRQYFVFPDLTKTNVDVSKPGTYELKGVPLVASSILRGKQITIEPAAVDATLEIREPNATFTMNSMPVFVSHPAKLLDGYVVEYDPTLARVTLVGKPEIIEAIEKGRLQGSAPKARLEIAPADLPPAAQPREKTVQFDLPEGVTVSPADRSKKVSFTIRERTVE